MTQIRVARLTAPGNPLEVGTADKPALGLNDVLVRVEACGLVPNAAKIIEDGGDALPELQAVFGLDVSGVIEELGDHVLELKVGDHVYVDPHLTCGTCHQCRRGRADLCRYNSLRGYAALTPDGGALLNQHPLGGLSEYVVAADRSVAVLPDSVDLFTAARFGYIGTSFAALKKGGLTASQTVLINGVTGTLGVAAVAIALGMGATRVLGIGRNEDVMERVRNLDPTRIEVVSSEDGDDLAAWATRATDGLGVDVLLDCLGNGGDSSSTNALLDAVKIGGRAVLIAGGVYGTIGQTYWDILVKDKAVLGSQWFTSGEIDELIRLVDAGVVDLSILEHKKFPLEEVNDAFAFVGDRPGGFTNVVVLPGA